MVPDWAQELLLVTCHQPIFPPASEPSRPFMRIQRALISVSDKAGIVDFARELQRLGVEILSTGGTASAL
jgi:hypothetical protein